LISDRLKKTILTELEIEDFDFVDETTANQVPNWDSLNHINVILAVEKEFKIKFKGAEILRIKNVGELEQLINAKLSG
jgi:acyl carrier protein